ncbi:neurofilament heavy polypeptide-like [Pundamilia nyererei]|uniref:Neurofilament heavy polypeptide-like n=1 Tax=Pundamilia nyererei TaxID=303518 RepID=A0A9Y3S483_9CICH|nr:PREDICTED: neurofilament heavy polypeptide-like [Pundamilia nyererei]
MTQQTQTPMVKATLQLSQSPQRMRKVKAQLHLLLPNEPQQGPPKTPAAQPLPHPSPRNLLRKAVQPPHYEKVKTHLTPPNPNPLRRPTPARDSQEPNKEEPQQVKESTPTKKSEGNATFTIVDPVQDEVIKDERAKTPEKRKRGRPKKDTKVTKKQAAMKNTASSKVADEEEAIYQIVDSVEDETADNEPLKDQNTEEPTVPKDDKDSASPKNADDEEVVDKEECLDHTAEVSDAPSAEDESGTATKEEKPKTDTKEATGSQSEAAAPEEKTNLEEDTLELVTLDEVGADDAGEERAVEGQDWSREITKGEPAELITLDEIVEEEEEEEGEKAEESTVEPRPPTQESQSVEAADIETFATAAEVEEEAEKTSGSAKRKHDETGQFHSPSIHFFNCLFKFGSWGQSEVQTSLIVSLLDLPRGLLPIGHQMTLNKKACSAVQY